MVFLEIDLTSPLRSLYAPSINPMVATLNSGQLLTKPAGRLRAIRPTLVGYVFVVNYFSPFFFSRI